MHHPFFWKNKNTQRLIIPQQWKHLFTLSYTRRYVRSFNSSKLKLKTCIPRQGKDYPFVSGHHHCHVEWVECAEITPKDRCVLWGIRRLTFTQRINKDGFLKHRAPLHWWLQTLPCAKLIEKYMENRNSPGFKMWLGSSLAPRRGGGRGLRTQIDHFSLQHSSHVCMRPILFPFWDVKPDSISPWINYIR